MTCSPEANQITASKILKWSLRTHSLSVSLYLCLSLAPSLLFLILSNPFPSFFLIISLNLFVPSFFSFSSPTHFSLFHARSNFVFPLISLSGCCLLLICLHPALCFLFFSPLISLCIALVFASKSLDCCLSCTHTHTHAHMDGKHSAGCR